MHYFYCAHNTRHALQVSHYYECNGGCEQNKTFSLPKINVEEEGKNMLNTHVLWQDYHRLYVQ